MRRLRTSRDMPSARYVLRTRYTLRHDIFCFQQNVSVQAIYHALSAESASIPSRVREGWVGIQRHAGSLRRTESSAKSNKMKEIRRAGGFLPFICAPRGATSFVRSTTSLPQAHHLRNAQHHLHKVQPHASSASISTALSPNIIRACSFMYPSILSQSRR